MVQGADLITQLWPQITLGNSFKTGGLVTCVYFIKCKNLSTSMFFSLDRPVTKHQIVNTNFQPKFFFVVVSVKIEDESLAFSFETTQRTSADICCLVFGVQSPADPMKRTQLSNVEVSDTLAPPENQPPTLTSPQNTSPPRHFRISPMKPFFFKFWL